MAYDELLAERVRERLTTASDTDERKMFGGLAFMVNTHMACGTIGDDLMVRVGKDVHDDAVARGAREMDFTGRPMRGMVVVAGEQLDDDALAAWVEQAVAFALSQPPKPAKSSKSTKPRK